MFDIYTGTLIREIDIGDYPWAFDVSSTGLLAYDQEDDIIFWDLNSNKELARISKNGEKMMNSKFSPTGSGYYVQYGDGTITCWDIIYK